MFLSDDAQRLDPEQPIQAYRDFLNAIDRRDVDGTLARMSTEYAGELRAMRAEANFSALFALWCDTYPECVNLIACVVAAENAIVQMEGRIDGLAFSGYAVLDRIGSTWRVSAESHGESCCAAPTEEHFLALHSTESGLKLDSRFSRNPNER